MFEGCKIDQQTVNGHTIVFRYPCWSDLPEFFQMRKSFHEEQIMANNESVDLPLAAQRLADILVRMETGKARWIFVLLDGRLVGQAQADISSDLYATIGLALLKSARGFGLGRILMGLIEREAVALGRRRLFLTVWSANTVAWDLYKKMGYSEVGRRPDWVKAKADNCCSDLVEMVKELCD